MIDFDTNLTYLMFYFIANLQEVEITELVVLTGLILSYSRIINFELWKDSHQKRYANYIGRILNMLQYYPCIRLVRLFKHANMLYKKTFCSAAVASRYSFIKRKCLQGSFLPKIMLESALKDLVECMKLSVEEESISDSLF